ncbi:MAG: DHH family phosphoesterase, partial [bacterium]
LWLQSLGKTVHAFNEEGSTAKFHYLPGHEVVALPPATPQKLDVFVALDTSVKNRLGTVLEAIAPGTPLINIDHHVSNENYGDQNFIDPTAPATGQILGEFFQKIGAPITRDMATNLFAAISTDTGSFQYAGTNERTFAAAFHLIASGVD